MKISTSHSPIILGIITLLATIPLSVFLVSQKNPGETRTKATSEKILVSLFPQDPKEAVSVGSAIEVRVIFDTRGSQIGTTDIILSFDPEFLFTNEDNIIPGTTHESYPGRFVDESQKIIGISADGSLKGAGTFATIKFITLKPGATKISFQKVFSEGVVFETTPTTLTIK